MLTFISGQTIGAQRCSAISAIDDSLIEAVETLSISLIPSPSDEDSVRFTTGQSIATVIIVQDPNDSASTCRLSMQLLLFLTSGFISYCSNPSRSTGTTYGIHTAW